MILNENYNGKTPLKKWWKIVRDNFRTIAANAVSKKELSDSVSEAITQYVSEDMEALEDVRQALQDNADVVAVLNSSITAINNHKADKTNPHEVTKDQVGLGNVLNVKQASKEEFDALAAAKSEVVFGTYNFTLDDSTVTTYRDAASNIYYVEKFIDLGFTPAAVEVYAIDGRQNSYVNKEGTGVYDTYGGFAAAGHPCTAEVYYNASYYQKVKVIEIAENGFYIRDGYKYDGTEIKSYLLRGEHYFKAYKYGSVINATEEASE